MATISKKGQKLAGNPRFSLKLCRGLPPRRPLRFGCLGPILGYVFRDAYRIAMADRGLPLDPGLEIPIDLSEEGGAVLADRLVAIEPRPTAVVLINELMAIGLYHRLSQLGMAPGRDLAVTGSRDNPQVRFLSPRLSCYHVALAELGLSLGETLVSLMPTTAEHPLRHRKSLPKADRPPTSAIYGRDTLAPLYEVAKVL